jgi:hypothetical protein
MDSSSPQLPASDSQSTVFSDETTSSSSSGSTNKFLRALYEELPGFRVRCLSCNEEGRDLSRFGKSHSEECHSDLEAHIYAVSRFPSRISRKRKKEQDEIAKSPGINTETTTQPTTLISTPEVGTADHVKYTVGMIIVKNRLPLSLLSPLNDLVDAAAAFGANTSCTTLYLGERKTFTTSIIEKKILKNVADLTISKQLLALKQDGGTLAFDSARDVNSCS